jgi:hypothetical protein
MEIGTQEISGKTSWELSFGKGMITRTGNIIFTVQYIKVQFSVGQPLNLNKKLLLNELNIELGNIQMQLVYFFLTLLFNNYYFCKI